MARDEQKVAHVWEPSAKFVAELKAVLMRPSGAAPMTSAQVQQIIDEFDANGDGELQFEEFASWWAPKTVSSV